LRRSLQRTFSFCTALDSSPNLHFAVMKSKRWSLWVSVQPCSSHSRLYSVLRYRSPLSHSNVTTVRPGPSARAAFTALRNRPPRTRNSKLKTLGSNRQVHQARRGAANCVPPSRCVVSRHLLRTMDPSVNRTGLDVERG
jgi:hypothetical protein